VRAPATESRLGGADFGSTIASDLQQKLKHALETKI